LTRPFFGWVSDMIGRENTMFLAFGIEGRQIPGVLICGRILKNALVRKDGRVFLHGGSFRSAGIPAAVRRILGPRA